MQHGPSLPPGGGYAHTYPPPPHGWPPPSPPPPKKRSGVVIALMALGCTLFASCVGFCGYHAVHAQTPEGKRELAAHRAEEERSLEQAIARLHALAGAPAPEDGERACPAGSAGRHEIVDSIYLAHAGKPRSDWAKDPMHTALARVRTSVFSDDLLAAAAGPRDPNAVLPFGLSTDAKRVAEAKELVVLVIDELEPPEVQGNSFVSGALVGRVVLVDTASAKALCQADVAAENSADIEYGGGVRVKVKGIPMPKVGDKTLAEAVEKDFGKNVEASVTAALKRIGAR